MERIAYGWLRLTPSDWDQFTLGEFFSAVGGFSEMHEQTQRTSWEQVRWQTAALLNVHTKKGQSIKPKDLMTFPWEASAPKMTEEQQRELIRKMDEYQAKQWQHNNG